MLTAPFRYVLAVILQVAALLALSIAAPAHARAHGLAEHGHAHVHHAHAQADHGTEASDASAPTGDSHSGQCCGLHCPFHIPFVGAADVTVALRWNAEATFRRPHDASFASVVSEALPNRLDPSPEPGALLCARLDAAA